MASRGDVTLLLRRAGFTPTRAEVDAAVARGPEGYVTDALTPGRPDPGAEATPPPKLDDPAELIKELAKSADQTQRKAARKQVRKQSLELAAWWIQRMVATKRPFTEKMAFFWHGHFATSVQKVRSPALMLAQQDIFRSKGLGGFDDLVLAVAQDPAMMRWLDTLRSSADDPNENFAREMFELFVLGHGNYSEQDVRQAARTFTGWRWTPARGFRIAQRQHDDGVKTVLGSTGNLGGEDVIRLAVAQPASHRWIASRIWSRFGAHAAPTDSVVADLLTSAPPRPLSDLFRAVLLSPALTSTPVRTGLVKQPVEWVVGAQRALGTALPARTVLTTLNSLGQVPFAPASVGGWPEGMAWLSTSATDAKVTFAVALASAADLSAIADEPASQRVDALADLLALDGWSQRSQRALAGASGDPARLAALGLISPEYQLA
ncbi:MAG TPA: DUF1800 domain-containing protein [Frankiaceae bacterium]|jgi:uncharacterized protein (DUF1800 family)|nr:DUF1800 domain-containing protein [Frankiaceae bacterium]